MGSNPIRQAKHLEVIMGTRRCMVATVQHLVAIPCHNAGNNVRSTQVCEVRGLWVTCMDWEPSLRDFDP